jgi:hypothetical protein
MLLGWIFYLPMAILGVEPEQFGIAGLVVLIYQFWIHTEHVGKLGWFDRVFSSPSNHRVHHAVNDQYLDKNYGGMLVIWDRMFGTFAEEKEPVVYGTRTPLNSWDPLWSIFSGYQQLLQNAAQMPRWQDKLKMFIKPPGWRPAGMAAPAPFDLDAARRRYRPSCRRWHDGPRHCSSSAAGRSRSGTLAGRWTILWLAARHQRRLAGRVLGAWRVHGAPSWRLAAAGNRRRCGGRAGLCAHGGMIGWPGTGVRLTPHPGHQRLRLHRPREQIALHELAAHGAQQFGLLFGFHTLGHAVHLPATVRCR